MSNYPPGVTGSEYAIAGPSWEGEIERSCSRGAEFSIITQDLRDRLSGMTRTLDSFLAWRDGSRSEHRLAALLVELAQSISGAQSSISESDRDYTEEMLCPFEGEVIAQAYGGVLTWTCPVCGYEHEEDGRD